MAWGTTLFLFIHYAKQRSANGWCRTFYGLKSRNCIIRVLLANSYLSTILPLRMNNRTSHTCSFESPSQQYRRIIRSDIVNEFFIQFSPFAIAPNTNPCEDVPDVGQSERVLAVPTYFMRLVRKPQCFASHSFQRIFTRSSHGYRLAVSQRGMDIENRTMVVRSRTWRSSHRCINGAAFQMSTTGKKEHAHERWKCQRDCRYMKGALLEE